jgi:iron-sulfur cluster repair protein YtfE (RIC family)
MRITEPLRREHAGLVPHLAELDAAAADVSLWGSDIPQRLEAIVTFLHGDLVPHARAEEAALYPAVERAMAAPGATDTMKADHVEIVQRITRLADTVTVVGAGPPLAGQAEQLRAELYGLSAILHLHFHKEEEVLLPVLDSYLTEEEARQMFSDMVAVAHPSKGDAE